ncbi:MAG TPA: HD domain-containing phosphohydrolase [Terriglobales bacterium]|nr:HD domain-containing phosphohydrolase [Terriglobales bacterium]
MPLRAKLFVYLTAAVGFAVVVAGFSQWESQDLLRFVCYLGIAMLASGLKVQLPGIDGTMSVNFLFILIGILELSFPETLVIGCASSLVQCLWNVKRAPKPIKVLFNVFSMMATAIGLSFFVYHSLENLLRHSVPLMLVAAACAYFLANTLPVAVVISLTEEKTFRKIWAECYFWSFPYYLAGAAIAGLVSFVNRFVGWQTSLLVLPIIYWIFRSYRLYLGRLEDEKRHVEDMAGLHLRTIEALALAIEAKDHTTHDHLQRVRVYALEIAKELGLAEADVEALRAAALLHDIGKLAVPEHIINKPGRLTPEEFEKMKIHPLVGAEILERVNFPYPVVPVVRSHHEKYDGSGYPDGLKGEEIPIGARILAAVDCLDALASDRQYRRALPLDEAMERVAALAGKHFDPQVVEIMKRRYVELEQMAQAQSGHVERTKLSTNLKVEKGSAPAAGFERIDAPMATGEGGFLTSIAAARQEAQTLFELSHDLGASLSLDETLSVLSVRLKKLVPYDSIAIYIRREDRLIPQHVSGDNFRLFSSLEIPLGQGLSGWVAQNRKPIVNGNPSVEPGYLNDPTKFSTLRSAMSVPLDGLNGVVGVLTLYKGESDAFTTDHLRILLAISSKVALSIENALKYQQAESSATTDYLTGLPNARSLFLHLDRELARCKRTSSTLAVMVCDLDGFKQINDRFGHLEGNKVLRLFAQLVKSVCREYDYVARMGGDEFVIVAPGMNASAAEEKASHLVKLAMQAGREVCGEDLLSLSVGTAHYPEDGTDAEHLLTEADRKMYIVKQLHHEQSDRLVDAADRPVPAPVN